MTDRLIVRRGYCLTQSKIKFDVHRLIVNVLNYLKKNDNSLAQRHQIRNQVNTNVGPSLQNDNLPIWLNTTKTGLRALRPLYCIVV
jgi:hypothetical protein